MSKAGIPVAKAEEPISDNEEALEIASKIGFPLMIKRFWWRWNWDADCP